MFIVIANTFMLITNMVTIIISIIITRTVTIINTKKVQL